MSEPSDPGEQSRKARLRELQIQLVLLPRRLIASDQRLLVLIGPGEGAPVLRSGG